jgi:arylsulfatase A-like enzyme
MDQFGQWYLKAHATECEDLRDEEYYDGAQTDLALAKLEELSKTDKPFFFGVGYYRPHLPFNAPKKYWDLYKRNDIPLAENNRPPQNAPPMALNNLRELRGYVDFNEVKHPLEEQISDDQARRLKHGYLASVSYIDAQIGRLVKKLDELEILDNTVIILWGDHGWKLGEKGSWYKMTNYGIDTRVPLIVSTPELRKNGKSSEQFVEFIDIYPSVCELANVKIPDGLEGKSFVSLLKNPEKPIKTEVFSQFYREGIWTAPDSINYKGYSVRNKDFLYVEWYSESPQKKVAAELYDLQKDPFETKNVLGEKEYHSVVEKMRILLVQHAG